MSNWPISSKIEDVPKQMLLNQRFDLKIKSFSLFLVSLASLVTLGAITLGGWGCSHTASTTNNLALLSTNFPLLAYSGEAFYPGLEFTTYKLQVPFTIYSDLVDTMNLTAYSDSNCTVASTTGSLSGSNSNIGLSSGVASFSKSSFAWTNPTWAEGTVYLKGTLNSAAVSYCSVGIPVIQHFNFPLGYKTSGTTGAAGTSGAANVVDQGRSHQVDSKGRYIIVGMSKNTSGGKAATLWRYLPNGVLDTTFGTGGIAVFGTTGAAGATGASMLDSPTSVRIDSKGRYVVAGTSNNGSAVPRLVIWRYTTDGQLDTSFNLSGYLVITPSGLTSLANVSAVVETTETDSIIILASGLNGSSGTVFYLTRISSSGNLDTSFGSSGSFQSSATGAAGATGANTNDIGRSIQLDAQGRYVIAGSSFNALAHSEMAIWRFTSAGAVDTTWGSNGAVISGTSGVAGGTSDKGNGLWVDSQNRYWVVGSSVNTAGGTELAIWRYLSSGSLDRNLNSIGYLHFGTTGAAGATGVNTSDSGIAIAGDPNGNFVVAGKSKNSSGGTELALWLYDDTGALNSLLNSKGYLSFGTVGAAGATGANTSDLAYSLTADPIWTYTIVGESKNSSGGTALAVWRYLQIGILDQ